MIVSPDSKSTAVAAVHMGISSIEAYSDKYGDTLHTSDVNDMTRKFFPKQAINFAWQTIYILINFRLISLHLFYETAVRSRYFMNKRFTLHSFYTFKSIRVGAVSAVFLH